MSQSTFKRFVQGMVAALALTALPVSADWLLDDLEHGANMNKLNQAWYFFNSKNIMTNFSDPFQPTDGGYNGSNYAAAMTFAGLLTPVEVDYATIGMGTRISAEDNVGYGSGFSGVTGVSFYAKGPANLKIRFDVETVEDTANDNVHGKDITISEANANTWTPYTVNFSEIAQESGWGAIHPFNRENVTKIAWKIKTNANRGGVTSGTFAVDNIVLLGSFTPPSTGPNPVVTDSCTTCVKTTFGAPIPSALLSDFDAATSTPLLNKLGGYWYSYNDSASGGTSKISALAAPERGRSGQGNAAVAGFTVGQGFKDGDNNNIDPFAGVGTNLAGTTAGVLDATAFNGVYFEYKTVTANPIKVELPEQGKTGDFYIKISGTNGVWKSATIPFTAFVLPQWAQTSARSAIDLTKLAKLQIVSNTTGSDSIFIDNVYFTGAASLPGSIPPVEPPEVTYYTLRYIAGEGGSLSVGDENGVKDTTVTVEAGNPGPAVKAVGDDGYRFVRWSDNYTKAERTDSASNSNLTVTASFEVIVPDSFTVTYKAGSGGKLLVAGTTDAVDSTWFKGEQNDVGPEVTAVADSGYSFVGWGDDFSEPVRKDTVKSNATFTAVFVEDDPDPTIETFVLSYVAGSGGSLLVNGAPVVSPSAIRVEKDSAGPTVIAVPDSGYVFVKWSDGKPDSTRTDVAAQALMVTAEFEAIPIAVASTDRVIPTVSGSEIVVVAPVAVVAGEFTVGPNPAARQSGAVRFFWSGRAVKSGKLSVFDASGNLVRKVNIAEGSGGKAGRRAVGSWDLKDAKGRPAADGTYLVKGVIATEDGAKVKASAVLGVR